MTEYKNELGQRHRVDGPAIERADGTKAWYQHGQRHRVDGPAVERSDGSKEWYQNGQRHRVDGPAYEGADGSKEWYVYGKDTTSEAKSWLKLQRFSLPLNKSAQVLFILRFG